MTLFGKLIFGIVALLVGTGVYYGVSSFVKEDALSQEVVVASTTESVVSVDATTTESTASTTDQKPSGKKIPFTEFLKQGGSYKCTVTQNIATMTTQGIVYIHGEKIKADFSSKIQEQTIDTTMVIRDGYSYTWTNMAKGVGNKVKILQPKADTTAQPQGTYVWNGEQVGDYTCDSWVADDTIFDLPKEVKFTEVKG